MRHSRDVGKGLMNYRNVGSKDSRMRSWLLLLRNNNMMTTTIITRTYTTLGVSEASDEKCDRLLKNNDKSVTLSVLHCGA